MNYNPDPCCLNGLGLMAFRAPRGPSGAFEGKGLGSDAAVSKEEPCTGDG